MPDQKDPAHVLAYAASYSQILLPDRTIAFSVQSETVRGEPRVHYVNGYGWPALAAAADDLWEKKGVEATSNKGPKDLLKTCQRIYDHYLKHWAGRTESV